MSGCALYDVVGSVKGHFEFTSRWRLKVGDVFDNELLQAFFDDN